MQVATRWTRPRVFLLALVLGVLFAHVVSAQDYKCVHETCTALIGEEGDLRERTFRQGDIISTEGGWIIPPDSGWVEDDDGGQVAASAASGLSLGDTAALAVLSAVVLSLVIRLDKLEQRFRALEKAHRPQEWPCAN